MQANVEIKQITIPNTPVKISIIPLHSNIRESKLVVHSALNKLLLDDLGNSNMAISFEKNRYGKPYISHPKEARDLQFNLAYTDQYALIAIARVNYLGIDIAKIQNDEAVEDITQGFFSKTERDEIITQPHQIKILSFFRCWVCKEAFLKAIGKGFSFPMSECIVDTNPLNPPKIIKVSGSPIPEEQWELHVFFPVPGYISAVCFDVLNKKSRK